MAPVRVQRIDHSNGQRSWTVIGPDYQPIAPVDEYLGFLTLNDASPNTLRSYAASLAGWMEFLELAEYGWDSFPSLAFGQYMSWLRYGDQPGVIRVHAGEPRLRPRTLQVRAAAVLSFYRYQAAANLVTGPYNVLYTPLAQRGRRPYVPFLAGIAPTRQARATLFKVRSGPRGRTPLLTPQQVRAILDGCVTQATDGSWGASAAALRNRFFFALLAETGLRIGEALSLRHSDIHPGHGGPGWVEVVPRQDHPTARVKSPVSRRVYVGADLIGLYNEWAWALVDRQADLSVDLPNAHVFLNVQSGRLFAPMRADSVYATIRSLNARYPEELPPGWSPHWLRHTHATALLLSGCPPHVVMRRLGHLDIQTTLTTYGWVTDDAELRAVADWERYAQQWNISTKETR